MKKIHKKQYHVAINAFTGKYLCVKQDMYFDWQNMSIFFSEKINKAALLGSKKDLIEIITWTIPKNSVKNRKTRNNIEIIKVYAIPTEKRSKDVLYRIKRSDNKFFIIDENKREGFLHYRYAVKVYRKYEEAKAQENRLKNNRYNHHFSYNCKNMNYKIKPFVLKTIIKRELLTEKL